MKPGIEILSVFILITLVALGPLPAFAADIEKPQVSPRVVLDEETWEGVWAEGEGRYAVFRGIPYAAPPTGDRRWRPPAPRVFEPGLHTARANGPACIQTQRLVTWDRNIYKAFGLEESSVPDLTNISEDCLYLNVWTPAPGQGEKLPVMVWIYGGSNRSGWAHQSWYDGASLARRGVVSVFLRMS